MHTPQGDRFDITLLRPIGWLESCNAQVGSSIHLVVSEQGLDGLADVLAIEPCPRISSGVGRVVTGTFTHVRGGILRIRLAGLAEPLGVTSNHSIYSADRLDFVPAGELRVGETLRNLDGDVRIESIEQLGSEERVYNLEIHGEHVFRVASSGLLVHNSSGAEGTVSGPQILRNKIQGELGEAAVRQRLLNSRSVDLVGEQIRVNTPGVGSHRVTDFLVRGKNTGQLRIIEIKTGGATRDAVQLAKDKLIADPFSPTTFSGRRANAAGFPNGTPTGPIRTFEVNASNLNR